MTDVEFNSLLGAAREAAPADRAGYRDAVAAYVSVLSHRGGGPDRGAQGGIEVVLVWPAWFAAVLIGIGSLPRARARGQDQPMRLPSMSRSTAMAAPLESSSCHTWFW